MTNTTATPPGWYPDPAGSTRVRWWDGAQWTEHYQEAYSTNAAALKAPEGTKWNTVWIWLIVLLPLVSYIPLMFIDWNGYIAASVDNPGSATGQIAMLTSPAYLLASVGSWLIYGLTVLFAYFDWRQLNAFGVPRPFHWAWAFLSIVYPIGRSVVVRRRTGQGIAPMWVAIATVVFGFGVGIYIMVVVMTAVFTSIDPYTYGY